MIKENSNEELFNITINDNIDFHIQRGTILTCEGTIIVRINIKNKKSEPLNFSLAKPYPASAEIKT